MGDSVTEGFERIARRLEVEERAQRASTPPADLLEAARSDLAAMNGERRSGHRPKMLGPYTERRKSR